jgi:hypothetical protein
LSTRCWVGAGSDFGQCGHLQPATRGPNGHLDTGRGDRHASGVQAQLGTRVHLRDVRTLDDLCEVTAPAPVESGDLVASAEHVYRVEVVLVPPPDAPVTPVLCRAVYLAIAAR